MSARVTKQLGTTPWQTIGPYFHMSLPWRGCADLVEGSKIGSRDDLIPPGFHLSCTRPGAAPDASRIVLRGRVLDASGAPVPDALLELWQDGSGVDLQDRGGTPFIGFGRAATGVDGSYEFRTLMPEPPAGSGKAPFLVLCVFGPGLSEPSVTRVYFDGLAANALDPILSLVPIERRATLLARGGGAEWNFDLVLSGPVETVFFKIAD